jgi:hypothetical protein
VNWTVTEKDLYLNWDWYTAQYAIDEKRHLKQDHIFSCNCEALAVLRFKTPVPSFLETR